MNEIVLRIIYLSIITFIINLPFGYWRASVKKKSAKWFMAIHFPIPIIIALRFLFKIGFIWYSYPAVVLAFFLGQLVGGKIYTKQKK